MGSELRRNELQPVFAKSILPFVQCLIDEGREGLGLLMGQPEIKEVNTSSTKQCKGGLCDRFKLELPYAGITLEWEILFDCQQPEYPPDIIFRTDEENFTVDITQLSSLENWNHKDPRSLVKLIRELLDQYKRYQRSLIEVNTRLRLEYSCLLDQEGYTLDAVEAHITRRGSNRWGPVNFLIKLPVKFGNLPVPLLDYHPEEDRALLLINFSTPDSNRVTPHLNLTNRLECVLGGSQYLRLPLYHGQGGLVEYVPAVCDLLTKKVGQICDSFARKKEYVSAFHSHFGRSILEYDPLTFSRLSLLLEWNDFFFIVHIDLSGQFPVEQPTFTFQSVYHENGGRPYREERADYPYSPRWTGDEMAERARVFFLEHVSSFQKASLSGGTLS